MLDCSVAIAWATRERGDARFEEAIEKVVVRGALVPQHWRLEVGNVLLRHPRMAKGPGHLLLQTLADIAELPVTVDGRTADLAWGRTMALAKKYSLTVYDAAYLEFAVRAEAVLLTLDRELALAAMGEGLLCLPG